jgi:cyclic dehypoxanthinyl futalosine synthase
MPLTRQQALEYFNSPDLIGLGFEADAVRRRLHPEGVVTYIIDRNINYTNFCTEYCTFCAFYRPLPKNGKTDPRSDEGYILEFETIYDKIAETLEMGGTGVLMQGGIHPDLKIDWFERLFTGIKQKFPSIWLHCLSASEVLAIAEYSGLDLRTTIARLRDAGLDSIPGGGAEILDDEVGETFDQRVNHFEVVRRLQEETGGFTAFIPWSFQPKHTALGGRGWDEATSVEYLKTLAISRLYLDNIENVQASWVTQGLKVLELGLHFGGNDVGSVMLEENVVKAAGTSNCTTEEELRRIIRDAGFKPVQRDTLYRTMFLN